MNRFDFLIIGGGIAGVTAAGELRRLLPNSSIGIISDENYPLYSRVLLPHYVRGKIPREKVFFKDWQWYAERGIDVYRGRTAARLDVGGHRATVDDGIEVSYGKLLIAAGGRPRKLPVPGADSPGVLPFRTLDDADRIVRALDGLSLRPENEREAAIIGGGLIGLEFPPIFRDRGFRTSFIIREPRFWNWLWDDVSGEILESTLTANGVKLYNSEECQMIVGDNPSTSLRAGSGIRAVRTSSGREIPARILGFGVGIIPNLEFAASAGVTCERGVVTDEYLMTNVPDIFAAGDVAEFWNKDLGRRQFLGNWMNAQEQGRVAAANMAGERGEFSLVSQYAATVFDLVVSFIGDVRADLETTVIARGEAQARQYGRLLIRDGRLVGATLSNRIADRIPIAELIKRKVDIRGSEAALADPATDLKTLF